MSRPGAKIAAVVALLVLLILGWWRLRSSKSEEAAPPPSVSAETSKVVAPAPARDAVIRRGRAAPPLERFALRGIVVDRTGAPVAGASVALATPTKVVRTGDDGRFEIPQLLPGRYSVEARHGARTAGPIGVELDRRTRDVTLRLYQGWNLEVEVVAADTGKPIAGADVEVRLISMFPDAGRQLVKTGADGIAHVPGLTFIGHDLRVAAPGFVDDRRGPGPDLVERSAEVRRLRIALRRAVAEVTGTLVDDKGAPIEGGEVEAVVYQSGDRAVDDAKLAQSYGAIDPHAALRSGLGTRSGAGGRFRIGLESGTWVLLASAPEHEIAVTEPLFVDTKSETKRDVRIVLGAGRTLRGVVVDGADVEVAAAQVEVRWLEGTRVLATTVSDGGGGFEVRGLPRAPVEVFAVTHDARSKPIAIDLVAADVEGAVIPLDLTEAITGKVIDDRGGPVSDAVITYYEERPKGKPSMFPAVVVSDHDGAFRIAGLAARASYFLSAARPQDGTFGQHAAGVPARSGDNVTITIPAGGAITGRIVGADPRQIVIRDQQTLTTAHPGADGRFRLERLPALRYQLRISGAALADKYIHDVDVGAGRDTDLGDIPVEAGRKVAGVVVDQAGRSLDSATVRIEVDNRYAIVRRAAGGRFAVTVPTGVPLVVAATHPERGRSAALALGAGASTSALRLAMLPGGTIRGVAKAKGAALADAPVTVWPLGPRPSEPFAAAITDDAGAYSLANVPAGKWLVELGVPALQKEHRVMQQGVEVKTGAVQDVDFDASTAPANTIVQPRPERGDIPVYGDEEPEE